MPVARIHPSRRFLTPLSKTHPKFQLSRGQLLEMVANAVELELGEDSRVVYDAHLPEVITKRPRQVDIAVFSQASGREYLRIVEVQDRKSKVGSKFVDEVAGKLIAVGAHRATIVSRGGFTKGAYEKLRHAHSQSIDAIHIRSGRPEEWPKQWDLHQMSFTIQEERIRVYVSHDRYIDPLRGTVVFDRLYGQVMHNLLAGVLCYIIDPHIEGHGGKAAWFMGEGKGMLMTQATLNVTYTDPNDIEALIDNA